MESCVEILTPIASSIAKVVIFQTGARANDPKYLNSLQGNIKSQLEHISNKDLQTCKRGFAEMRLVVEDNYGLSQITRERAGLATNHKSRT